MRSALRLLLAALAGGTATAAALTSALATATGAAAAPAASGRLTWAPPPLTAPAVVQPTASRTVLALDPGRDYVVQLPGAPLVTRDGLSITGGRNVVLVGGEIRTAGRGLYLKGQTGTVHVEGLRISGRSATEGIDLDERRGAVVQVEDVVVEAVHGSRSTNHADVLQTWAGPAELRVDRLEGWTTYQGLFLAPGQFGDQPAPRAVEVRNTVLRCAAGPKCGYLLWQSGTFPVTTATTAVVPVGTSSRGQVLRAPGAQASWDGVLLGSAGAPSPVLGAPGTGYTSPGYAAAAEAAAPSAGARLTTADGWRERRRAAAAASPTR